MVGRPIWPKSGLSEIKRNACADISEWATQFDINETLAAKGRDVIQSLRTAPLAGFIRPGSPLRSWPSSDKPPGNPGPLEEPIRYSRSHIQRPPVSKELG